MVIPKVSSVAYVDEVSPRLDAAGAPADMTIWAMIETPTAIFDVRAIVAHPRVSVLVMGTNDLARELRAQLAARPPSAACPTWPPRCWPPARPAR